MYLQPRFLASYSRVGFLALAVAGFTSLFSSAFGQELTAEALLAPMVEEYGPQYEDVEKAIDSLRAKNVEEARKYLDTAYEKNKDLPPPNTLLAQILFLGRNPAAGRQALDAATANSPQDPAAYIYLGDLALGEKRQPEAAMMYRKGLDLCQNYTANQKRRNHLLANAYGGLALMEEQKEAWPEAKTLLDQLLKYDSDNTMAKTRLGRVLFKMAKNRDDEKLAYRVFMDLHRENDKATRPEINMALLYEQSGQSSAAESLMKKAVEKDGDNISTRLQVAKWALDTGRMDLAKQNAAAAEKIKPDSPEAKLLLGLIHRLGGNYDAALELFKEVHFMAPTHLGAMSQLALTLSEKDDDAMKRQAVGFAEICVRMYPDVNQSSGREAALVFAWCLNKMGRGRDAVNVIAQAIPKGAITADGSYFASQVLFDNAMSEQARKVLEPALKSDRSFPHKSAAIKLMKQINEG